MRIQKLDIKPLKEQILTESLFFDESFNFSDKKNDFDKRAYNLSLIIGENGTRKTTIMQLILNLFNSDTQTKNNRFKDFMYSITLNHNNNICSYDSNYSGN